MKGNILKKLLNISIKILCVILSLFLFLYLGLWIYIIKSVPAYLKQQYEQYNIYNLSDNQYKIIWFSWTENKYYRFKWYPFIIDGILKDNKDSIDSYSSLILLYDNEKYRNILTSFPSRLPLWNIEYGLTRYIRKNNNYKKCINIIVSKSYMDGELYGFEDVCKHYYNKELKDTTEKELISLALLARSTLNRIENKSSEDKTNEIFNKYYNVKQK